MEKIYIAAGGTAGHINAALALGEDFSKLYDVEYLTGTRHLDLKLFKEKKAIYLESKPLRGTNPFRLVLNLFKNLSVFLEVLITFSKTKPKFLIGAGGYVCGPTLLAAKLLNKPIFVLEQNACAGLTNQLLAKIADKVFVNFEKTTGFKNEKKIIQSGNPIRSNIKASFQNKEKAVKVLIYGGSLGSKQINDAIDILQDQNRDLKIKHQVGKNNLKIKSENINYEQVEYIDDMQEAYDWANIIIARSGASTVSELSVVGKPAVLIPFPGHADNHQVFNANELKRVSGFDVEIIDNKLMGKDLSKEIEKALGRIDIDKTKSLEMKRKPFEIILKVIKECTE